MASSVRPLSDPKAPLFRQIYDRLKDGILSGAYSPGQRLPSTRALAEESGVSRTIVVLAYEQLLAEGYVEGRKGSGTYVSEAFSACSSQNIMRDAKVPLAHFGAAAVQCSKHLSSADPQRPFMRYDFAFGKSDLEIFPLEAWRRIILRKARGASLRAYDYGPAAGNPALQESIATYLRRSRGVDCQPSQVLVVSGSQQALDLATRVLLGRGDRVVIEEPQYGGIREILRAAGTVIRPVPVDGAGLVIAKLPSDAKVAVVTPSHQFPTGAILSLSRRLELLQWSRRSRAVIIEDDYDGEFRHGSQPLEPLQALDREGRVIYIGTFSRTMFPSLRLGYMVVPQALVPAFTGAKWLSDRHTATLEQEAMAEFISSGLYERHLRRVRRKTAQRRQALERAVAEYLPAHVGMSGQAAGAHVVLWLPPNLSEDRVIAAAARRSVGVYGLATYFFGSPKQAGILLGYMRLGERHIREGVRLLGEALMEC